MSIDASKPAKKATRVTRRTCMWIGAFGGVIPFLVRGAISILGSGGELSISVKALIGYSIAGLIMAVAGGVLAYISQERTLQAALAIGMSLPSLFQVGALQKTSGKPSEPGTAFVLPLVSTAYAQPPPGSATTGSTPPASLPGSRVMEVDTKDNSVGHSVIFLDEKRRTISTLDLRTTPAVVDVPPSALFVGVSKGGATSNFVPVSNEVGQTQLVLADIQDSVGKSFLAAFGLSRAAFNIEVRSSVLPQVKLNDTGWIYLGRLEAGRWWTRYFDSDSDQIPTTSQRIQANSLAVLRPLPNASSALGILAQRQMVEVKKTTVLSSQFVWAEVTVK